MRNTFLLFMLISSIACSQKKAESSDSNIFLPGKKLSELTNPKLHEVSGLAPSINNPGLLWTENDSGNGAEIFLVDQNLNIKMTCILKGIKNRDWEDIAVGPGPEKGKSYVYVAEIGDNLEQYPSKNIYRFEEPVFSKNVNAISVVKFDTITFRLEDGVKDAEALMIDPSTKDLYIISKREQPVYLYELKYPYSTKDTLAARKLTTLPYTQIVAAAFSPNGKEILIKNYKNVYFWKKSEDHSVSETLKERPYVLEYTPEPQGEAVCFASDGSGFYTISEKLEGKKSYLYFYPRKNK